MAIVKMKKLRLLAVRSQRDELLRKLLLLGCVQIDEPLPASPDMAAMVLPQPTELEKRLEDKAVLESALALLDKYAPRKTPILAPKPQVRIVDFMYDGEIAGALEDAAELARLDDSIRQITEQETRVRGIIESLEPWETLDMPLERRGTDYCSITLGQLPNSVKDAGALDALTDAAPQSELIEISNDGLRRYFVLLSAKEQESAALDFLRENGYSQIATPSVRGTAADNIRQCRHKLDELSDRKNALFAAGGAFGERRDALRLNYDRMCTMVALAEASQKLPLTDSVLLLQGWIPAPEVEHLTDTLRDFVCAWETGEPETEEIPDVPVKLKNNRLTRCLNMVTNMYSLPAYDGVDPNPLMAPFFILFYGIMLADMGYGLLMILGAIIVLSKKKPLGGGRDFFELLFFCGISTLIWGAATGSFFGDAPLQIAKILNPDTTWQGLPYLFTPLNDTVMILFGSMALGFVHIVTGMAVSFVEKLKKRQFLDAVFEELTWWIVFAGIGCMVLGAGKLVLIVGCVLVVAGPLITGKGFGRVIGIVSSVYNHVTGYFGDILSYSRIMALMLAGSVIALVFNTIGAITGNIVGFLVISIAGNAINFALNLLGCYVHDLRLQCLEFFNKFYKDGGKPFRPLTVSSKYYNVDNVNN